MSWFDDNNPERPQRDGTSTPTATPPAAPGNPYVNGGTTPIVIPPGTIIPPNGGSAAGLPHGTAPTSGPGSASGDPARDAVTAAFAKKGITPNPGEVDYWVGKINDTGGWANQDNQNYWSSRMAQDQGGVGDRQGRPEPGGGSDQADLLAPFTEQLQLDPFTAPTGVDETNDPGYKARLGILQDARQRQAAAQGNLLSGSTSQALDNQASDYASQEYGNVYNRAYQTWQGNQQQKLTGYNAREQTFYANQNNPFAKLYAMSSLDSQNQNALNQLNLGYAGLGANTITGGANRYSDLLTGGANATAAGQVGAGNAYAGAFGQVSQLPFQYAAYNSIFNNKPPTSNTFSGWPGSQAGG